MKIVRIGTAWLGLALMLYSCGGTMGLVTPATADTRPASNAFAPAQAESSDERNIESSKRGPIAPVVPISSNVASANSVHLTPIAPTTVNVAADKGNDFNHLVAAPLGAAKNRLFVFLPGSGAQPSDYQAIVREAAARGYHAIGLTYENSVAVNSYCDPQPDPKCWGAIRNEILTGQLTSTLIHIAPADSIEARLNDLLYYLDKHGPGSGWGQFHNAKGAVDWTKVVVGGHSQGGGHAAFLAKLENVSRLCYFDSPADSARAYWPTRPNVTPASSMYAFTNKQDSIVPFALATQNWNEMQMSGPPVAVPVAGAPSGNVHELFVDVPNGDAVAGHSLSVADRYTPMSNGLPLYTPVWDALCFS